MKTVRKNSMLEVVAVIVTIVALFGGVVTAAPPTDYLSLWEFEGNANDTKGVNNGTLQNGAATAYDSARGENVLNLDGVDDYVDVGTFDVTGSGLTIVGWIKSNSYISQSRIISKAGGDQEQDHYWMFGVYNSSGMKLRFRLKTDGATTTLVADTGDLDVDVWIHVAAVYDGSNMILYKNGAEVDRVAKTGTISTNASVAVNIGRNPVNGYYFRGAIDDLAIYQRGLTPAEIQSLYSGSTPPAGAVKIMPCGDSITYDNYSGDTRPVGERHAYRSYLWYLLTDAGYNVDFVGSVIAGQDIIPPFDPDNEGHGGWTDAQVAAAIYNWLIANPADIVLLHIGTNGLDTSPNDVEDILDEIDRYETNTGRHVTVLLARIINRMSYSADTTTFNNNVQAMAEARTGDDIVIVDMENGAGINYTADMIDNLHPNETGYSKMADLWFVHLQDILSVPCPNSMTHYWRLEEAAEPYADSLGTTALVCTGTCPAQTTGIVGNALVFDGTATGTDAADDGTFDWGPNDSFTIELWMNKANPVGSGGVPDNEVIVGRDDPGSTQLHWWFGVQNTTGGARFQLRDTNAQYMVALEGSKVDDGAWHHLAAVRDAATDEVALYVDSVKEANDVFNWTYGFALPNVATNIGWIDLIPYYHYDGIVDEIAVYDEALSGAQIADHYNEGLAGFVYCTVVGADSEPNCPASMVSYWKFEETTGQTYEDSYNGHDADGSVGTPTPGATGIVGNALSFNGTSDYVTVPDSADWDWAANDSFTIELWCNFTNAATRNKVMIGRDQGPGKPHWWLGANQPTGVANFNLRDSNGSGIAVTGTTPINDGQWHHLAVVRDESLNENRIYVDGVMEDADTYDYQYAFAASTTIGIGYMAYNLTPDYFYEGLLDEIAIFNEALTQAQILQHIANSEAGQDYCVMDGPAVDQNCPPEMISYWKFDETSGAPYADSYGGNDATCTNCPTATAGTVDGAQWFDGTDDEVNVADNDTFDWGADDNFTIEYWMNTNQSTSGNRVIVGRDDAATNLHWWTGPNGSGYATFQLRDINGNGNSISGSTALNDGNWHQIVCVRDNSVDENRLYVDGAWVNTLSWDYTAGFGGTVPINIGYLNLSGRYRYHGAVDEVAIFDKALTDAEIQAHYDNGIDGNSICVIAPPAAPQIQNLAVNSTSGNYLDDDDLTCTYDLAGTATTACTAWYKNGSPQMLLYMPMEGGSSNALLDYSGSGNHGTCPVASGDCPVWNAAGGYDGNGCFDFDGDDDFFSVGDLFDAGMAYTKTAWVYYTPGNPYNNIVSGNSAHAFWVAEYGGVFKLTAGHADPWDDVEAPSPFPQNTWTFAAVTYDPLAAGGTLRLYINGSEVAGSTGVTPLSDSTVTYVGSYNGTCCEIKGSLDEVRVYDHALSPEQIAALYVAGELLVAEETTVGDTWQARVTPFSTTQAGSTYQSDIETITAAGLFSLKINCGGPTVVDGSITWEAGSSYVTGGADYTFSTSSVDTTTNSIAAPVPPLTVYKPCRHNSPHTYSIPGAPNGEYVVRIHWIDQVTSPGLRQIDYDIEGVRVQEDWDIYAEAGGTFVAIDKEYSVTVSDGDGMQIVSSAATGDAFESAIEITQVPAGLSPPTIVSTPVTSGVTGMPYTYDVDATGNPDPNFSLTVYPAGMTIDDDSGLIEWTPPSAGDYNVTVVAANGQLPDANQSFVINVTDLPPYPAGMVHYYRLDETVGSPYVDSYGDTDATCTNCPTPATGTVLGAQQFDGVNDEVQIPDDGSFDWAATDSFTIELWMKTNQTSPANNMVIIGRDGGPTALHWWIGTDKTSGKVRFQLQDTTGSGFYLGRDYGPILDDNQWHHVVCTRNDSNDMNKVYVDGVLVDSASYNYTSGFAESVPVNVGYILLSTHNYRYNGAIDELAVYDRALLLSEVQTHYANGLAGIGFGPGTGGIAPTITSTPVTSAMVGEPYTYDVDATGTPAPDYSLTEFPAGMTINQDTGLIQWTPSAVGDANVTVVASNGYPPDDSQSFVISVLERTAIMPLGDSITDGAAGSTDDTGYRRELYLALEAAGYAVDFVGTQNSGIPTDFDKDHEGHGGWHANQIRDNIYTWLETNHADIVLLHIGTNDISGSDQDVQEVNDILINIQQYEDNYSVDVKVLVARIILRDDSKNPQTIAFNDAVEAMVNDRIVAGDDLVVVDMENALVYPDDLADTVHPDDGGYSKMADEWFAVLDPILEGMLTDVWLRSSSGNDLDTDDLIVDYTLGADAVTAAIAWFVDTSSPIMSLYMPMEGGDANAVKDFSGNANDGLKVGAGTAAWQSDVGHDGYGAFYFNGAGLDTGVSMPTDAYTKTAWVKLESGENMNNIISGEQNPGHAFWVSNYSVPGAMHLSAGHADPWNDVADAAVFAYDVWTFVAVSYDPDVDSGTMVLYKNGTPVDSSTGIAPIGNNDYRAFVGSYRTTGPYFKGYIDDARIYNRALSAEQIAALYDDDPNVLVAEETAAGEEWWAEVTPFSASTAGYTWVTNSLIIQSSQVPGPPTITSTAVTDATLGQLYTYDVDASGLPEPNFLLVQAPADMDINSVTGLIEWLPTVVDNYDIIAEANNIHGYDRQSFTITVTDAAACDPNMTHYYHLDEASAPFANSTGTTPATCTNCPAAAAGIVSGAQYFDGVDDEVNVADDGTFDWPAGSNFTIEYWMNSASAATGNDVLVGRQGTSHPNPHIWVGVADTGDQALFVVFDSGGSNGGNGDWPYGGADITDGQWHHVVAVKDSTHIRLYVDGSEKAAIPKTYPNGFAATTDLNIGYLNLGDHYRYEGLLDEVAVYNRALTPTEVADHYAAGLAGNGYCGISTIVPDCVGLPQAQAETDILAASLSVGAVSYEYSGTVPAGYVISQYPAAGKVALMGIPVDLVVSAGSHPAVSISGYVLDPNNRPIEGVMLQADNAGGADVTDANGFYELWVAYEWYGKVTPSKTDWSFDPNEISYPLPVRDNVVDDYLGIHYADFNADGWWDYGDVAIMHDYWLQTDSPYCNLNEDNIVDMRDYAEFAWFFLEE